MDPRPRRPLRWLRTAILSVLVIAVAATGMGWLMLRGSLPRITGTDRLPGLHGRVVVERDAQGVPTITAEDLPGTPAQDRSPAAHREDLMRALGYLHAQDRFFQMDLLRRKGGGELAELFGPALIEMDRAARIHRFRRQASEIVHALPPDKLGLLQAYAEGVNAGLASLSVRPWEYVVLRTTPRPWQPEDTQLVADAMVMVLEDQGGGERTRLALSDVYGPEAVAFLQPLVTEATAALDGSYVPAPPVPGAAQMRPRASRALSPAQAETPAVPSASASALPPLLADALGAFGTSAEPGTDCRPGSNNFALAGSRVAGGGALVANDPHLGLSVPHIWYRARLVTPEGASTGVTLPGTPALVLGSNGHVAWAFTNSQIDTSDVVIVERDPADPERYRVPDGDGWEKFEPVNEEIRVAGRNAPVQFQHWWTRWGPVIVEHDAADRTLALHWSEHDPDAMNVELVDMLAARNIDDAVAVAHRTGQHPQNFVTGDNTGAIAWTILGKVPRRVGFEGTMPVSWADGTHRWDGFLRPDEVPVVRNPPGGELWTANNRVEGGEMLKLLGNGEYADPGRAAQIRDDLHALAARPATAADGLAIQLDDEARYYFRWRDLLLSTLSPDAVAARPALGELRELVSAWHGHASVDEAGYRLVRGFRYEVMQMVMDPIYAPVKAREPGAEFGFNVEQPLWSIVSTRPDYLLPAGTASWDALLRKAALTTTHLGELEPGRPAMRELTWGRFNTLRMRHPFSLQLPWLSPLLDMPAQALPGDANMPRVQRPAFGASMRMVVIPGREGESIFEQPGGPSGHFLSPFYRTGQADWVAGRPSPFLPGAARYRLMLSGK